MSDPVQNLAIALENTTLNDPMPPVVPMNPILPVLPIAPAGNQIGGDQREAKFPNVNKFDGNPKQSFEFLSKLQVYFYLQPHRFANDVAKCYYVGLRCESAAAIWFNSVLIGPDAANILSSYDLFIAEFKRTFDDPTRVHDAERRLLTMKQGRRSVAQMIPEFKINVFTLAGKMKIYLKSF